ncbi:MAG: hypothetical protein H0V27_09855 [Pyrinomonadaceae bacterium]|nr:hypothetical protein [Pyrinomonadaceae bacterium]
MIPKSIQAEAQRAHAPRAGTGGAYRQFPGGTGRNLRCGSSSREQIIEAVGLPLKLV